MLIRALIVLLAALNIGVAAWWIARPAPPAPAAETLPLGVARLQLVDEGKRAAKPVAARATGQGEALQARPLDAARAAAKPGEAAPAQAKAAADSVAPTKPGEDSAGEHQTDERKPLAGESAAAPPPAPAPAAPAAKPQCFSVGPFADTAAADAARAKLLPLAQKVSSRTLSGGGNSRGWRVYLPAASAEAAQATAQRIRAAGFNDLFVMSGAEANAIALGRFRNEESARKRGAELAAAGFAAKVEALGESNGQVWLDAATVVSKGEALRVAAGAQRWRGISCDKVR
ncbi:Sporulation related domain-containing protein [Lysobacter sp. yr284]|uniref:SPOR domain-containing protein n=1 Tax=Lysobacter sp. yr284 TaxID=1761791 RepID=UPI000899FEAD|nr:SPOR domain-containing protein [Lysobacter sp. yr284]SDZ03036.1 Sporulation related domain-containing protein [Lysobacter sp. yr284]